MKVLITIPVVLILTIILSKAEQKTYCEEVLTVAVFDLKDCHPPCVMRGEEDDLEGNLTKVKNRIKKITGIEPLRIGTSFVHADSNDKYYLITCEHVVHSAGSIKAFDSEFNEYNLEMVGYDIFHDVAVLRFKDPFVMKKFKPVVWQTERHNIDSLVESVGYWNPDGTLNNIPAYISNKNFSFKNDNIVAGKINLIEMKVVLPKGYSGGPIYDKKNQVVGMSSKRRNGYARSYAIPAEVILLVFEDVIKYGAVLRSFLGMRFVQDTLQPAVKINAVFNNAPATPFKDRLIDSEIKRINNQPIQTIFDVLLIMEKIKPNDSVKLEIKTKTGFDKIKMKAHSMDKKRLEEIACFSIREKNEINSCIDIYEENQQVNITFNNDKTLEIESVGYRLNEHDYLIYCLNDLTHFGYLTRLLSLYGKLEVDDDHCHSTPNYIHLSQNRHERIIFY